MIISDRNFFAAGSLPLLQKSIQKGVKACRPAKIFPVDGAKNAIILWIISYGRNTEKKFIRLHSTAA